MVIGILTKATEQYGGAFSAERIALSLEMTLLGLGAVFSVLAIIWFVLALFKYFLYDLKNPSKEKTDDKDSAPVVAQTVSQPTYVQTPTVSSSDDATVAAIMAAISAYISEDPELSKEYAGGFRVVSFKRVRAKASWNTKNN